MKRRTTGLVLALLLMTACAPIQSVSPGPLAVGDKHTVVLNRQWSDVSAILPQRAKNVRVLSIDGPLLNRLYIAQGLRPGEGLIRAASKEQPVPTYHADMGPTELAEFVAESAVALGYQRVETAKLRPAKFGAADALRLDLSAKTQSGLEISGVAQVSTVDGKLYLMLYLAPSEHYFTATLPDVEAILNSAA